MGHTGDDTGVTWFGLFFSTRRIKPQHQEILCCLIKKICIWQKELSKPFASLAQEISQHAEGHWSPATACAARGTGQQLGHPGGGSGQRKTRASLSPRAAAGSAPPLRKSPPSLLLPQAHTAPEASPLPAAVAAFSAAAAEGAGMGVLPSRGRAAAAWGAASPGSCSLCATPASQTCLLHADPGLASALCLGFTTFHT